MKKTVLIVFLFVTLFSCKKAEDNKEEISVTNIEMPAPDAVSESVSSSNETANQKIIKKGKLKFEASNFEATSNKIYQAVKKYNGQIFSDVELKEYNSLTRNIIVRVPNNNFDPLIKDISQGITYFDQKEISSEDVTSQYIDLEARLKAKKVLEERYLDLLKKATKIDEILEIEKQISVIREEIEAKQGQLNYLQNKVALSTIEINFYKPTSDTGVTVSYGNKVLNALKGGVSWIPGFFLSLLYIWPLIVLAVLGFYIYKKRKKNKV